MSDTQDPLIVLQHRMQQRQILAMMGINQWVQPSSETIKVADIAAPVMTHTSIESPSIEQLNAEMSNTDGSNIDASNVEAFSADVLNNEPMNTVSDLPDEDTISRYYHGADNIKNADDLNTAALSQSHEQNPVTYSFDTTAPHVATTTFEDAPVQQAPTSVEQTDYIESRHDNQLKVAPFDLQGGRYGNWVVLVDIQALNNEGQKLWGNITQALSITCETTSFPICEGMDTAELANASLAGYLFKIGRSEEIQVAALTVLPDGLEHPNLASVPTLDEMLADSSLKRQLWEQLSG